MRLAASNAKCIDELCAELAAGEQIQAQSLYVLTNIRFPHEVIGAASQAGNLGRQRGPNVEKRTVPLLDVGARAVQQHHLDQLYVLVIAALGQGLLELKLLAFPPANGTTQKHDLRCAAPGSTCYQPEAAPRGIDGVAVAGGGIILGSFE
jgi:hypothetical protein